MKSTLLASAMMAVTASYCLADQAPALVTIEPQDKTPMIYSLVRNGSIQELISVPGAPCAIEQDGHCLIRANKVEIR